MSRLDIKEVRKSFGKTQVLNGVSLSCKTGEIIGLFGRNGSGKSTLLKIMMGTLKPDFMDLLIDGVAVEPSEVIPQQKIGFLPQDSFLPKEMKVRDVIPLIFPKGEEQDKIFYSEGVAQFNSLTIGKLSAGQLKYLELLLVAHLPQPFLLLDEPFSMVEPQYIEKIKELLLLIKAKKGILMTDHYYRDVLEISDRGLILKNGNFFKVRSEQDLEEHEYLKTRKNETRLG